jgi:hypothetical protein
MGRKMKQGGTVDFTPAGMPGHIGVFSP